MAVEYTVMIKMDMDRKTNKKGYIKANKQAYMKRSSREVEETITMWYYHVEVPCKVGEEKNKMLIKALDEKFAGETEHTIVVKKDKICCTVLSSCSDYHVTIEDLHGVIEECIQYFGGILEEHQVEECILTLELQSDFNYCVYMEY